MNASSPTTPGKESTKATSKHKSKLNRTEALIAGDRDLMKSLLKEALQEVLEGELTEFLGASPSERTEGRQGYPPVRFTS